MAVIGVISIERGSKAMVAVAQPSQLKKGEQLPQPSSPCS